MSADGEGFEPIRTLVDPTTAVESTVSTYSSLTVAIAPIECHQDHSHPKADGSACVCTAGFYRGEFGGGWSCERCSRGFEPGGEGTRCVACVFGTYSADGEQCTVCDAGYEPNQQTGAVSCSACDETSASPDGVECKTCPPDQEADASHTSCVCPINMYNSSLRGGNQIQCLVQGLRGDDAAAAATCMPCGDLECVTCDVKGLAIRPEYAVAQSEQSWLVFRCPFDGACLQDTGGQRCKAGHTGLLCAECSPGYGLDRDDCVKCSATNSSPLALGGMLAVACFLAGLLYLWRRRSKGLGGGTEAATSEELSSEGLFANPLRGSSSSGLGKAAAVARKSTDIYMLMRVVYQPVRIVIGYIQVTLYLSGGLHLQNSRVTLVALTCRS